MTQRNTQKLKELIFTVLNTDSTLQGLLGGSGKIKHANPLAKAQYPCVVYDLLGDIDEPYESDVPSGVSRTRLMIQIFSNSVQSKQADDIEDRIYELLHGKSLSNSDYIVYTSYRDSRAPFFEAEISVWRIESRYDLVNGFLP